MAGDDDSDVKQALAVLGAAPIGYRNFRRVPVPAQPVQPIARPAAPVPTRLTLQWPAQSFARRPEASLGEVPSRVQPAPNLRAIPPSPAPSGDAPRRSVTRDAPPARMPAPAPGIWPVPATEGAPRRGKLPLAEMFRVLAGSSAAEATPLALPPMFRRL